MKVDVPEGTSEEDVVNALVESIAETLGVHPSTIAVEYDPNTGEVVYTITSEDAETLADIASVIEKDSQTFEDEVNANLASTDLALEKGIEITVSDITSPTEIVAEIEVIVDATDSITDPKEAIDEIETKLEEEGNYLFKANSIILLNIIL